MSLSDKEWHEFTREMREAQKYQNQRFDEIYETIHGEGMEPGLKGELNTVKRSVDQWQWFCKLVLVAVVGQIVVIWFKGH